MIAASKTVSLACVALWALLATAAAAQTPAPGFRQEQTREGCLYYSPDFATTDWTFTWLGSCVRGRLIDGKGTLEGSGPQGFTPRMSGQIVGGYFHGPVTLVSIYPVPGRQDMIETQNFQYNMGCNVTWSKCKPAPTRAQAAASKVLWPVRNEDIRRTEAAHADFRRVCKLIFDEALRRGGSIGDSGKVEETQWIEFHRYRLHNFERSNIRRPPGTDDLDLAGIPRLQEKLTEELNFTQKDLRAGGMWSRYKVCGLEVALNHAQFGVPGFEAGARPMAIWSAGSGAGSTASLAPPSATVAPAAPVRAAPSPRPAAVDPARAQREAEGRQLLNTAAVQKLLREPNRAYDRSVQRTLTPSLRILAENARQACQSEYEGAFVDAYASGMGGRDSNPALVVAGMDINFVLPPTQAAERAAAGEAEAIRGLSRYAERDDAGGGTVMRCVARHHLERLGIPIEDEASVLPLSGTSPSTDSPAAGKPRAEEDPVDTDEYADRCLRALIPGQNMGGGGFGAIENKCGFPINYTFCNLNPRPGSWSEAFDCSQGKLGSWHVGANGKSSAHTAGAERVYMLACRAPADTRKTTYQLGRGIIGECR